MKNIKRILTAFTLILFIVVFSTSKEVSLKAEKEDNREMKAVWMSTFIGEAPYSSETQFKNHMNNAFLMFEYYGINTLIFHVRTHNNAFYPSELNPRASWWSDVDFDEFDPVAWLIDESHNRGIEFHAWMNPYRVTTGSNFQSGEIPLANPQSDPNNLIVEGSTTILNPAKEVVREHIYDTIIEFAELYPSVDAIHFDDYFYINTTASPTGADARRANIDLLIEGISNVLSDFNETNNTAIQFGISPTGIYRNGNGNVTYDANGNPLTNGSSTNGFQHYRNYLYADTVKWAVEGWIDYLMPQTYWARNHTSASFTNLTDWWNKVFKNLDANLYAGLGVYMADSESNTFGWQSNMNELDEQLELIDSLDKVKGYSIYSYKHLANGYNNASLGSGQQIRNAYNSLERRTIRVLPEVNSINPYITASIKNISYNEGTLSWDSVTGGKFYYIYQSDHVITYSTDEIVGVIGHQDGRMSYDVSGFGGGNFSVRAISITNHYSPVEDTLDEYATVQFALGYNNESLTSQIIQFGNYAVKPVNPIREGYEFLGWYQEDVLFDFNTAINSNVSLTAKWKELNVYTITYNLNGGSLAGVLYNNRDEMITDFLTDFYNFVNPGVTLNTFIHGIDKVSGFDGLYNGDTFRMLFNVDDKSINASTGKFINQPEYNKWVVLLDLMDEYTTVSNNEQTFWGSYYVAERRIKPFIQQVNLRIDDEDYDPNITILITEIVNRVPHELEKAPVVNSYTKLSKNIELPSAKKDDHEFLGWYNNSSFSGSPITVIMAGSTEDFNLYARFEEVINEVTLYFDLGYNDLWLPNVIIVKGNKLENPPTPERDNYIFGGWILGEAIFDFNEEVYENLTFTAFWKSDWAIKEYMVTFSLGYDDLYLPFVVASSGSKITAPETPTRSGYSFVGWYYGLIRFDFTKAVNEDYDLVAMWTQGVDVNNLIETIEGASIRVETEPGGVQRLRFYGKIDSSLLTGEFGFYAIYGETTPEILLEEIKNSDGGTIYINGQDVKRQAINKADYKNEFSVALTGIPKAGYADRLTVIAYAKDKDGNLYLSNKAVSRSVLEVALKMEEVIGRTSVSEEIILCANTRVYKLAYDAKGDLIISSGLFEENHKNLKESFIKDWNKLFNVDLKDLTASSFFDEMKSGSDDRERNNTNISQTNIYKFFNNSDYGAKWGWFLNYLQAVDYTIHAKGQAEAIKGSGTYTNPNISSNSSNLYNASHLAYSIYNFFNETHITGSYTAINFSSEDIQTDGLTKYDRYNLIKNHNDKIYIDASVHKLVKVGDTIKLPELTTAPPSGYQDVYFDGVNYYAPLASYNVIGALTFELKTISISSYQISFYENDKELIELKDYYLTSYSKELPVINKTGYTFDGWYSNKDLTGSPTTMINEDSVGDKTFYAKFTKSGNDIFVTYDFKEFGYHTTSKLELFKEFRKDYKEFYNLSTSAEGTIYDFYPNSVLVLPNKIEDIFLDPVMGAKWGFLLDYIFIKAEENNYVHLNLLKSYNQEVWRLNIQGFFADVLFKDAESIYTAMDFSNLELGNSFWVYTTYNSYVASYNSSDALVSSDAVKIWNENYMFVGWANTNNQIITDISLLDAGTHTLKAVYKIK